MYLFGGSIEWGTIHSILYPIGGFQEVVSDFLCISLRFLCSLWRWGFINPNQTLSFHYNSNVNQFGLFQHHPIIISWSFIGVFGNSRSHLSRFEPLQSDKFTTRNCWKWISVTPDQWIAFSLSCPVSFFNTGHFMATWVSLVFMTRFCMSINCAYLNHFQFNYKIESRGTYIYSS